LAALEAHDAGLRITEDAVNDHHRHKSGKAIGIPEVSPQS
jgi:hypothetical protein